MADRKPSVSVFYGESCGRRISVTGTRCDHECPHCNRILLEDAVDCSSGGSMGGLAVPEGSYLVTGGRDAGGAVPLESRIGEIAALNASNPVIVRPGFVSDEVVSSLIENGIEVFSVRIHQDPSIIGAVMGLERTPEDYSRLIDSILSAGGKVVPRITAGFGSADFLLSADLVRDKGLRKAVLDMIVPDERTSIDESVMDTESFLKCARYLMDEGIEVCIGSRRDPDLEDLVPAAAECGIRSFEDLDGSEIQSLTEAGYEVIAEGGHFALEE